MIRIAGKCLLVLLLFRFGTSALAQEARTISGQVRDASTGEALIGAAVVAKAQKAGTYTNAYGFYSLSVPADSATVRFSFLGYQPVMRLIDGRGDTTVTIELQPSEKVLDDVVIEANSLEDKLNSSQMSMDQLTMMEAKRIPALFGEVDIIKTLQLKPGVQSGGEGLSGIYVRGGGPDQNLVLLDEAPVYNPTHLFGLFSTFNGDAVKDVKLYKGGYPAEFGGKLSSVIDVRLNEGNKKKLAGAGGLGLISSRLTLEAPIIKDKASFMVAGRRTYFDIFTRLINEAQSDNPDWNPIPDYYFYDLNAKVNYNIGDKDQLFASGYLGRDVFGFGSGNFNIDLRWGNTTGALRWTHIFSPRVFMKTIATYSDYNYQLNNRFSQFTFDLSSGIRDYNLKSEILWLPNSKHEIKVGTSYIYHGFSIARFNASSEDGTVSFDSGSDFWGHELGVYINDDFKVNPRLTLNGGLRISGFVNGNTFYKGLEPRLSGKYKLADRLSLKASYTRMFQYVHMVSNSGASLPTDIWYPSNPVVQPQRADQVAAGISLLLGEQLLLTNEAYYKWLENQVDFRDGAQIFFNPNLDEEFVFGKGWGYGNEIYLEKKKGNGKGMLDRLTGWLGYTLSWSWREFPDINRGNVFHPRYDRRHDVSVVLMQELNRRLSLTATWVYGTGQWITLAEGRYLYQDAVAGTDTINIIPVFGDRNSFRMPGYHRMDLGLIWKFFPKWGNSDLTFSIYNVYNRRNPFFIFYDEVEDANGDLSGFAAKQVSLFPIIPSITWNFKF